VSLNPAERWALQASYGRIHSPEQLEPEVDQDRATASAMYDGTWGDTGRWEGTFAWGLNHNRPGHRLAAFLAEAGLQTGERHTVFVRAERVEKDELFVAPDLRAGSVFHVGELTAGYRYDFWRHEHWLMGVGAMGTLSLVPEDIRADYGDTPASGLLFLHAALH
jgi:hypothetical protein